MNHALQDFHLHREIQCIFLKVMKFIQAIAYSNMEISDFTRL